MSTNTSQPGQEHEWTSTRFGDVCSLCGVSRASGEAAPCIIKIQQSRPEEKSETANTGQSDEQHEWTSNRFGDVCSLCGVSRAISEAAPCMVKVQRSRPEKKSETTTHAGIQQLKSANDISDEIRNKDLKRAATSLLLQFTRERSGSSPIIDFDEDEYSAIKSLGLDELEAIANEILNISRGFNSVRIPLRATVEGVVAKLQMGIEPSNDDDYYRLRIAHLVMAWGGKNRLNREENKNGR